MCQERIERPTLPDTARAGSASPLYHDHVGPRINHCGAAQRMVCSKTLAIGPDGSTRTRRAAAGPRRPCSPACLAPCAGTGRSGPALGRPRLGGGGRRRRPPGRAMIRRAPGKSESEARKRSLCGRPAGGGGGGKCRVGLGRPPTRPARVRVSPTGPCAPSAPHTHGIGSKNLGRSAKGRLRRRGARSGGKHPPTPVAARAATDMTVNGNGVASGVRRGHTATADPCHG